MYDEIRVMNTPTLISMVEQGSDLGFNRTIEPEWVKQNVDPEGMHVATMLLRHHTAGFNRELPVHHRVELMMKIKDTNSPVIFIVDIADRQWSWLYTVAEWTSMLEEAEKDDPDFLSLAKKFGRVKYSDA